MRLQRLDHVAINVPDVVAAKAWYERVLGLRQVHGQVWGHNPAMMMTVGGTGIALFPPGEVHPHIAFGADSAMFLQVRQELDQLGIDYTYEDHGPTESIYFLDPFGQRLEITRTK